MKASNFAVRTVAGAVFGIVMVGSLLLDKVLFGAVFMAIMLFGMQEFFKASAPDSMHLQKRLALLTAAAAFMLVYCHCAYGIDTRWFVLLFVPLISIPVSCIFGKDHSRYGDLASIYSALLYISLPVSLTPCIAFRGGCFDGTLLLSFFIIIWVSDVGAYCVGTLLGQKPDSLKLAPSISPKKSWWGFSGAVVLGTAAAVVLNLVGWLPFAMGHSIACGIIISVAAVAGDLVESLWKRHWGIKDSGNCIPGHGGMLDRFDSSLVAIPLVSAYLAAFALI